MRDDELMSHAASGELHRPEALIAQARQMLLDRVDRHQPAVFE
ncbi:MAG TPA: DUF1592 domain-containing protein [Pirellulales bacterium]|nr:DUF1592 domain-containing protein [Pirellulales bacterium]